MHNRQNHHNFDPLFQLDDIQISTLQVNMFCMGRKYINIFVQIIETVFSPQTVIESMFVLHTFLSKIITAIKSEQEKKSTQTMSTWIQGEMVSKMFLRELNYFDRNEEGWVIEIVVGPNRMV